MPLPPSPRRVPLERTRDDRRAHGPERQQESPGYVDDRAEDREEALYAGLVRPRYAGAPRAYQFLSQHGSSPCRDACVCGERLSVNPMISARADIAAAARPMEKAGEVYGLEWVRIQPTLGKPQRMQRHILPAPPGATRWLNRARQRAQAGQTPSSVGGLRQHPVGKHHLDELVFGIPRGVDLALIGVHVAVEPDRAARGPPPRSRPSRSAHRRTCRRGRAWRHSPRAPSRAAGRTSRAGWVVHPDLL